MESNDLIILEQFEQDTPTLHKNKDGVSYHVAEEEMEKHIEEVEPHTPSVEEQCKEEIVNATRRLFTCKLCNNICKAEPMACADCKRIVGCHRCIAGYHIRISEQTLFASDKCPLCKAVWKGFVVGGTKDLLLGINMLENTKVNDRETEQN